MIFQSGNLNVGAGSPQNSVLASGRIDYNIDSNTQVFGRYSIDHGDFFAPLSLPYDTSLNQEEAVRSHNLLLNLTRIWSKNLVSESRIVYGRSSDEAAATPNDGYFPIFNNVPGEFGSITLPSASEAFGGVQNLYQVYHTMTLAKGSNTFKFGGQYVHIRDNSIGVALLQRAVGAFGTLQKLIAGQMDYLLPFDPKGAVQAQNIAPPFNLPSIQRHFRYNEFSFFVQDTWKVSPRLTLTPGLRWEYFGVLHSPDNEKTLDANFYYGPGNNPFERIANGTFARTSDAPGKYKDHFYLPDYKNFAPRFGFAYDLNGDGKTVLRGGAGAFYDRNF